MKPYNERLPMIDEAIDTLKTWRTHKDYYIGDVGREANPFKLWKWLNNDLVFVCKKSTFNNRLSDWRVLYEWAMEAINSDSRPSFEDFVSDQRKSGEYQHIAESEGFVWEHHRAKEQRVKEREAMENKSDWYEKGELPPVGEVVFSVGKNMECKILEVIDDEDSGEVCICRGLDYYPWELFIGSKFRPLRTERDKLIEKALKVMRYSEDDVLSQKGMASALIDAGWRPTEKKDG